ncbi:glycosyltransferase family 4 protein [Bacteroides intestinalis]|uniref:glycosyltransferase family 4 protein n=1 Tax=Bacteroides intestinalis TaxID=329854 RepID=UPI0032C01514
MKIAYCIPALYNPSGMERVLTMKANYLALQGYEIHIILTDGGDKPPYFPLEKSVQVHQLDIDFEEPYHHPFWHRVWLYQKKMKALKKQLNACLCELKPDITVSLLRRDVNVINQMTDGSPKVGEIHFDRLHYRHFTASWMPTFIYSYVQKWWMGKLIRELKKLDKFVVLTHEDAAFWPELNNVIVVPNPTSFFPDTVSDCTRKQVIAAGRYVDQKGFDRLISAWQKVSSRHPDWVLKIYGDGGGRESLQQQITELGLNENCILEHSVSDIAVKFQESSIFVLSSRYEGFGLVIVEAMSCGLPVVSFACHCGPRDIITEETDGFLVPEGDIDGLAEKINLLIEEDHFRKNMGKMARLKAENYKMEKVGVQWTALFESLLKPERK